jgi:hypothetical protein
MGENEDGPEITLTARKRSQFAIFPNARSWFHNQNSLIFCDFLGGDWETAKKPVRM